MTDMMGEVRLGLWADDVGNEPFKAGVSWGWEDRRKSVLQISQWDEIENVGQKGSQRDESSMPTFQEAAQKESTGYNFLYSLLFANSP